MSLLLQISDPHFGTERAAVAAALQALAWQQRPDVLLLSGDITQRARRSQFAAARQFVDSLRIPQRLVLPGNHDIPLFDLPTRLLCPYGHHRRAFGDELEPVLDTATLLAIGVNTTRPRRHKDGEVSAAQIARVADRLRGARREQLRVVVTHQPVHVYREQDAHNLLHNREAAVRAWAAAGADLVLGGHIHLPYVRPLREHYADLHRELWCVQAGTALSSRTRWEAPNSVNLIRHRGGECRVERWDYRDGAGFEAHSETVILLDRPAA